MVMSIKKHTIDFQQVTINDVELVGGKNASLGEMMHHLSPLGIAIPAGFATSTDSFREFLNVNGLEQKIHELLTTLPHDDVYQLAQIAKKIRTMIIKSPFSKDFEEAIKAAYHHLTQTIGHDQFSVAVRSSATNEDLPDASFAGQQETFLNIQGVESVLVAIKNVFASLYNDRAITYRVHQDFSHHEVALSVGVQQMVRSDLAVSGVMFTLDTESGFDKVVLVTSSYGLGEMLVQGAVNPDEFYVYKPSLRAGFPSVIRRNLGSKTMKMIYCEDENVKTVPVDESLQRHFSLTNAEVEQLAHQALLIEQHYGCAMDIEWAKDGHDNKFYMLQARPETVQRRDLNKQTLERYILKEKGMILSEGRSIGQRIGQGRAKIIKDINELHHVAPGDVLISDMTDPDWEPVMKRAAAIVTNRGGRTCHAAIIARELGIPAVVGCGDATRTIKDGESITVSCAEGDTGYVYEGLLSFEHTHLDIENMPKLPVKIMLNLGNPERAFSFQSLPNEGVGLARLEFLISNTIGIHPKALLQYDSLQDKQLEQLINEKTAAYASPVEYYIERLKEGIATIAAAFHPKPVIVRLSDFKSNEYANLIGGSLYEPKEENPMLGFRGAARYVSSIFADCFALECVAMKRVRDEMNFTNVEVMIPFVRTVTEAKQVILALKQNGLERGKNGLRLIMMCELPSNALLAEDYLEYFDGFSIGSNDLTQLTLGLDRDSALVSSQFDERDKAVKTLLHQAIFACKKQKKYVGICGQGPSDHQDFAVWLMQEGIDSISLNPDSVFATCLFLAKR
jgi:pyruvate,water dikinase